MVMVDVDLVLVVIMVIMVMVTMMMMMVMMMVMDVDLVVNAIFSEKRGDHTVNYSRCTEGDYLILEKVVMVFMRMRITRNRETCKQNP